MSVTKILCGSTPKLKKIGNDGDDRIFEILPHRMYGLLSKFALMEASEENVKRAMKLAQSRPSLAELSVNFQRLQGHQVRSKCHDVIQSLLPSSFESIKKLFCAP